MNLLPSIIDSGVVTFVSLSVLLFFWPAVFLRPPYPRVFYRTFLRAANILLGMALIFVLISRLGWLLKASMAVWKIIFVFISRYYLKKTAVPRSALAWMLLGNLTAGAAVLSGVSGLGSERIFLYSASLLVSAGMYGLILKTASGIE